ELIKKLQEAFPAGKVSCVDAREFAAKLGLDSQEIGKACNASGIKIFGCELGCFK
ncbi:MAG: hypothetical protein GXY34_10215, partial [Syntrophomonadaceae bacterium]|nr:hypothetical protein [Syntrophomonadaceae bacterium]